VIRLRKKLGGAADAVKGLFGVAGSQDEIVEKLETMQVWDVDAAHAAHQDVCS
jgi:hypothetical protein